VAEFKPTGISSFLSLQASQGRALLFRTPKVSASGAGTKWVCQARNINYDVVPASCRAPEADIS